MRKAWFFFIEPLDGSLVLLFKQSEKPKFRREKKRSLGVCLDASSFVSLLPVVLTLVSGFLPFIMTLRVFRSPKCREPKL